MSKTVVAGTAVLLALGAGWFALSWRVMHSPAGDAAGESFGVMFALLIVVSAIGAIRRKP